MCDEKVRDKNGETGHAVSPGEAEKNRGYSPSGQGIFGPRFEAGTPKICLRPYRYPRLLRGRSLRVKILILYPFAKICLILCANIYLASGLWMQQMEAGVMSFTTAYYASLYQFINTEGKKRSHMWNDIENCSVDKAPKILQHRRGEGGRQTCKTLTSFGLDSILLKEGNILQEIWSHFFNNYAGALSYRVLWGLRPVIYATDWN